MSNSNSRGRGFQRDHIDDRLQQLESGMAAVVAEMRAWRGEQERQAMESRSQYEEVQRFMRSSGRINFSWIIGIGAVMVATIGLIITIMTLAFQPVRADAARNEERIGKLEASDVETGRTRWTAHDQADYERQQLAETRRLEGLIVVESTKLDNSLQREMRLLDDALQREMRMLLDAPLERLKAAEEIAKANQQDLASRSGRRFNREDFDKYVAPELEELDGRLRHTEEELARRAAAIEAVEREQQRARVQ